MADIQWDIMIEDGVRRHELQGRLIWGPRSGMQENVFRANADVIGLGGEAGGGKSDTLFGLAWYRHSRSIAFRRELTQMENRILARGNELFVGTGVGEYRGQPKYRWDHARGFLRLGALNNPGDFEKYRGGEWSGMYFDEATDMLRENVQAMMGWNRSTTGVRCQAFMYFNPPQDVMGEWVIDYFAPWIDNEYADTLDLGSAEEGEIRWFITNEGISTEVKDGNRIQIGGRMFRPESRTFFRSYLKENPDLGEDYMNRLQSMPFPLNEQLLNGDFNVGREPGVFQVIPTSWLDAARRRWTLDPPDIPITQIGVDIARAGKAQTVLFKNRGGKYWDIPIKVPGKFTPDGQAAADLIMKHRGLESRICVDIIGVGSAVHDVLKERGVRCVGVNVANATDAMGRGGLFGFTNIRSEMWWKFREALEPGYGDKLFVPKDDQLKVELCSPRFRLMSGGRIQVESKEEVIKRIGRSTDSADSLLLSWWRGSKRLSSKSMAMSNVAAR